jgi:hypothetical protein
VPPFLRDGQFVEELRRHMLSFARAQLRDDDTAG